MTGPVAQTQAGAVRGTAEQFGAVFRSVPYAAPAAGGVSVGRQTGRPTQRAGAARFAAPEPVAAWSGERDATAFGPTAPMPDRRRFGDLDMQPLLHHWVTGADYRTVNVWTPDTSGRAPVLVFVHGGAFLSGTGSASVYDGTAFARDGIVLVTCNYRLGVPGWLSVPGAPENRGLLDVIAALSWVRDNIAAFGGDPERVTVCGQSAGGMIVSALLTEPAADGLFRRAISQSGGLHGLDPDRATDVGVRVAQQLGVPHDVASFAEIPDERLVAALTEVIANGPGGLTPVAVVRRGAKVRPGVELMLGNTTQEARLYQNPAQEAAVNELFRSASERLADEHAAAGGRALRYRFDWRGGPYGACHAVELPFVFETTGLPGLREPGGLLGPTVPDGLARRVHDAWVGFARDGDPGWTGEHRFTG